MLSNLTGRLPRRTSLAVSGSRRWSWRGHSQGWAATVAAAVRAAAAATATAAAVAASSASAPCAGPARWTRLSPSLARYLRFHRRRGARWSQSCRARALKLRASAAARLLPRSALRPHHCLLLPGLPHERAASAAPGARSVRWLRPSARAREREGGCYCRYHC